MALKLKQPKRSRWRLVILIAVVLVLAVPASVLTTGYVVLEKNVPGGAAQVVSNVSVRRLISDGEIRYTVPMDLLQREVGAIFPITEGVEGMLKLDLRNPRFESDADGAYLRVAVDLEVQLIEGKAADHFPGHAVMRAKLHYDRPTQTVRLAQAELAEFSFSGEAAAQGEMLRPVVQAAMAASMADYEVFRIPASDGYWSRKGVSMIRDVTVEKGQVVVTAGL